MEKCFITSGPDGKYLTQQKSRFMSLWPVSFNLSVIKAILSEIG